MTNRKMTKEEIAAWEKRYEKDLPIISGFLYNKNSSKHYRLFFEDGTQLIAESIGSADSYNDLELNDPYYEEFFEFYFIVKKIEKKGTELNYKEDEGIALNYHNFFIKFEPYNGEV